MEGRTNERGHLFRFSILSALVLLFVAGSIWSFSHHLERTEQSLQRQLLIDVAQQRGSYVDARIEGYLNALQSIATFFGEDLLSGEDSVRRFQMVAAGSDFYQIGLVNRDGILLGTDGGEIETLDVSGRDYWSSLSEGSEMVTGVKGAYSQLERSFYVGVPIRDSRGAFAGAVMGVLDLDRFQTNEQTRLDMQGYRSYVVDGNGDFILRDDRDNLSWQYENLFDQLAADSGFDGEEAREKLSRNEPVSAETKMNGVDTLLYFTPMEVSNWYSVAALPQPEIRNHIATLLDRELYLLMGKTFGAVAVLAAAVIWNLIRITRQERESLRERAERDALTGLYNRAAARARIGELLERGEHGAMVILDLDDFKTLNDTLGHQRGDQALRDAAETLRENTRQRDIVCRLGGDEFALYLPTLTEENLTAKLDTLMGALVRTYREGEQEVAVRASAGVALFPKDAGDVDTLYTKADNALYEAKGQGKGGFCRAVPE